MTDLYKAPQTIIVYTAQKPYKPIYIPTEWFFQRFKKSECYKPYLETGDRLFVEKFLELNDKSTDEISHICKSLNLYINA